MLGQGHVYSMIGDQCPINLQARVDCANDRQRLALIGVDSQASPITHGIWHRCNHTCDFDMLRGSQMLAWRLKLAEFLAQADRYLHSAAT
jgi:hypothetical protein